MTVFKGSCTAMVTPFSADGKSVNIQALEDAIEHQLLNGTNALLVLGTTGEPSTMTTEEKVATVTTAAKKINKRVPLIVGSGGNNTDKVIKDSVLYESLGADALLIVTPYYNKCTQQGLIEHYTKIAKSVDIPIILYNVPSRTGVNIEPDTVARLAHINNIVAIKEASSNMDQVITIASKVPKDFSIYSGEDSLIVPMLSIGAKGVISVVSNIVPECVSQLTQEYFNDNHKKALDIQLNLLPLIKAMFSEVNPIPVKTALNLMHNNAGPLRLPLSEMSSHNFEYLVETLEQYDLLD